MSYEIFNELSDRRKGLYFFNIDNIDDRLLKMIQAHTKGYVLYF